MWILIVVNMAVSQSYMRETVHFPVVTMQEFGSKETCLAAANVIYEATAKAAATQCVKK